MYLYIGFVSIILYFVLQFIDDKRNMAQQKPLSTMSAKVAILFFSIIITTTAFYLFWDNANIEAGTIREEISGVEQDIETGFPDF